MKKNLTVFLIVSVLFLAVNPAMAESSVAGQSLLLDLSGLVKGSVGTTVGLLISLYGFYRWIIDQETWGIVMILGGAIFTAFPGVFDSLHDGVVVAFSDVGLTASEYDADL